MNGEEVIAEMCKQNKKEIMLEAFYNTFFIWNLYNEIQII